MKTPYPPNRVCPLCGAAVEREDGALYCVGQPECPNNEYVIWMKELAIISVAEEDEQ